MVPIDSIYYFCKLVFSQCSMDCGINIHLLKNDEQQTRLRGLENWLPNVGLKSARAAVT